MYASCIANSLQLESWWGEEKGGGNEMQEQ